MTTHQPPAQPDYLTELTQLSSDLSAVHSRLSTVMHSTEPGDGQLPDEWHDCYLAAQALHLAVQLTRVAIDNERARRAPVPYLPVEVLEQASALIAGAIESGVPVIVTDAAPVPHDKAWYEAYARGQRAES